MTLQEANEKQLARWDSFVDQSINGTIFHKRKFLAYHGDKFKGKEHFLVVLKGTEVVAQISLAFLEGPDGKVEAKSPYGASYGGFVFSHCPSYGEGREIASLLTAYLRDAGADTCTLTQPIACCCECPMDTFSYNLLEQGFRSSVRNISSVLRFQDSKAIFECVDRNTRHNAKKAAELGVEARTLTQDELAAAYDILLRHRQTKFGVSPTHSKSEFLLLHEMFPDDIYTVGAFADGRMTAGMTCFCINKRVNSDFYSFQDLDTLKTNSLTVATLYGLSEAQRRGFQYFDFGTTTIGMDANAPLFEYKESFSCTGMFRETFVWKKEE